MNFRSLWLVFFLFPIVLFAQQKQKIDSLETVLYQQEDSLKIDTYGELIKLLVYSDIDKAKVLLDEELALAKKLGTLSLIAKSKLDEGNYYSIKSEYKKSELAFTEAKNMFLETHDTMSAARASNNMVRPLMYQGNYEAGLKAALYALRINEKFNAPKLLLIGNYMAIGNIQSTLEKI